MVRFTVLIEVQIFQAILRVYSVETYSSRASILADGDP